METTPLPTTRLPSSVAPPTVAPSTPSGSGRSDFTNLSVVLNVAVAVAAAFPFIMVIGMCVVCIVQAVRRARQPDVTSSAEGDHVTGNSAGTTVTVEINVCPDSDWLCCSQAFTRWRHRSEPAAADSQSVVSDVASLAIPADWLSDALPVPIISRDFVDDFDATVGAPPPYDEALCMPRVSRDRVVRFYAGNGSRGDGIVMFSFRVGPDGAECEPPVYELVAMGDENNTATSDQTARPERTT